MSEEAPLEEEELNSEGEENRAPLPLASKRSVTNLLSHSQEHQPEEEEKKQAAE